MAQKDVFLSSEGNAYYERNRSGTDRHPDLIWSSLQRLQVRPKRILEIGCSDGHRLRKLREVFGSECYGIDPSSEAVHSNDSEGVHLSVGTADRLDFASGFFDLVMFGFCLYVCDPQDHFLIAAEANRVLEDGGLMAISDFCSPRPYRNPYAHKPGIFSYKMEYARMFTWHPGYRLLSRTYFEHATEFSHQRDEAVSFDVMRKDFESAFASK